LLISGFLSGRPSSKKLPVHERTASPALAEKAVLLDEQNRVLFEARSLSLSRSAILVIAEIFVRHIPSYASDFSISGQLTGPTNSEL
jgi:hypothetical protein